MELVECSLRCNVGIHATPLLHIIHPPERFNLRSAKLNLCANNCAMAGCDCDAEG
jgi:hypothetical protein